MKDGFAIVICMLREQGVRALAVAAFLIGAVAPGWAQRPARAPLPYIDVHVHPVSGSLDEPRAAMEEAGIRKMILMPPPQAPGMPRLWDYESFVRVVRAEPARFAFLGGGGSLNVMIQEAVVSGRTDEALRERFARRAREILAEGASGFGEMTAHHLSHMPQHPYESAPADHPLFLLLADIAGEHEAVIDLHFDVVAREAPLPAHLSAPPNPPRFAPNLAAFERLLAHNRKARIVWAHAGSDLIGHWTAQLSAELLGRHPNLYMSIRMAGPKAPAQNLLFVPGRGLDQEWLRVLEAFPERFVLGGDQFFAGGLGGSGPGVQFARLSPMQRRMQAGLLGQLPPELARRIGYENAMRLYRLKD